MEYFAEHYPVKIESTVCSPKPGNRLAAITLSSERITLGLTRMYKRRKKYSVTRYMRIVVFVIVSVLAAAATAHAASIGSPNVNITDAGR